MLPGMAKEVGAPPKKRTSGWTNGKGVPIEPPARRGRTSMGKIVPVPTDRDGHELRLGFFQVLQRTDGGFVVFDPRRPLGRASTQPPLRSQDAAVRLMRSLYETERKNEAKRRKR